MFLHTCRSQGPLNPSICAIFMLIYHWAELPQAKNLVPMHTGSLQSCLTLCGPGDCALPGFSVREGASPGKNTGAILASTGCHALLEHYISCCPSRQPPWVPDAARNPATQAAAPPPHLTLTGANPSPPGQPQEQTPVDDPHAEVEIIHNWNPGAV